VQQAVEQLAPADQARVLASLAEAYGKLSQRKQALKVISQAQQAANATDSATKSSVLVKIATMYARLYSWKEALAAAQETGNEVGEIEALSRILIIGKDAKKGTKNMDALEELFQKVR